MKKISIVLIFLISVLSLTAGGQSLQKIEEIINACPISKLAKISVSVRDISSEKVVYSRDDKLLLHPASTLKAFTVPYVLNKLGKDYKLTTAFYTSPSNKTLYIKLSGDPLLKSADLNNAIRNLNLNRLESIVVDDKIIDNKDWGVGWMWDDNINPYMPKYSAYNINHNLSAKGIPVENPKQNFVNILKYTLKNNNILFKGSVKSGSISSNSMLKYKIERNLLEVLKIINQNSDNLAAETLLKIASRDKDFPVGTTERGISQLTDYYKNLGINNSDIVIVDASGVSHNDLLQTDWMSLALAKIYKTPYSSIYLSTLSTPGKGTLTRRFLDFPCQIWAKTGTLSAISGIIGYIKTDSGKIYSFAILIQNYVDVSEAKKLEDEIVSYIRRL